MRPSVGKITEVLRYITLENSTDSWEQEIVDVFYKGIYLNCYPREYMENFHNSFEVAITQEVITLEENIKKEKEESLLLKEWDSISLAEEIEKVMLEFGKLQKESESQTFHKLVRESGFIRFFNVFGIDCQPLKNWKELTQKFWGNDWSLLKVKVARQNATFSSDIESEKAVMLWKSISERIMEITTLFDKCCNISEFNALTEYNQKLRPIVNAWLLIA